jgi:hypothetical protein
MWARLEDALDVISRTIVVPHMLRDYLAGVYNIQGIMQWIMTYANSYVGLYEAMIRNKKVY